MAPEQMLESQEAARRLGVKVTTLYAYVSRGLLVSHPAPAGRRRSLFAVDDVERLAQRSRQGRTVETRMATITTAITQLGPDGPIYRGRRATDLATSASYEEAASWLWQVPGPDADEIDAGRDSAHGGWVAFPLDDPPVVAPLDRIRWALVLSGATGGLRADLRPQAVVRTARRVAASMVAVLPSPGSATGTASSVPLVVGAGRVHRASMAERLTAKLAADPSPELVRAVNATLVLLADHELATSTLAVRLAASTRADVCDALLAGLGTLAGPLHGGASQLAFSLLADAERDGAERALDDTLRWQGVLPGFGHTVYTAGDPRFEALLPLFEALATTEQVVLVRDLIQVADGHDIPAPNVDLALAAIAWSTGMSPEAGRTLFAVARVAGWVAHYLEELGERPLRYRARAVYTSTRGDGGGRPTLGG